MMNYKLKQDYVTPCFTIHSGSIKSKQEWIPLFPKIEERDFDIKSDWFERVALDKLYTKDDLIDFGNFICKKSVSFLIGGADYLDGWLMERSEEIKNTINLPPLTKGLTFTITYDEHGESTIIKHEQI